MQYSEGVITLTQLRKCRILEWTLLHVNSGLNKAVFAPDIICNYISESI